MSLFISPDGINIEIEKKSTDNNPITSGFCNPCIWRVDVKKFLDSLEIKIEIERETPNGIVYFFKDYEGIMWYINDIKS